jgi:hypothetical protein
MIVTSRYKQIGDSDPGGQPWQPRSDFWTAAFCRRFGIDVELLFGKKNENQSGVKTPQSKGLIL